MSFDAVILCEKPRQARIFAKAYNLNETKVINNCRVAYYSSTTKMCAVHLSGHLLELCPPQHYKPTLSRDKKGWNLEDLPVIPSGSRWKLTPKYDSRPKERTRINALLKGIEWALVKNGKPKEIAIAVDNDKEGELLGWETLEYFGVVDHPNITRLMYSQVNEKALREAFKKRTPGSEWFPRYIAGLARQYGDWMIGMNVTMALTVDNSLVIPPGTALNSGRVVYAICYLLYLRHQAIKAYKPQNYYTEHVLFKTKDNGKYNGKVAYPEKVLDKDLGQLIDPGLAKKYHDYILKIGEGEVVDYQQERKKTGPPLGFHRTGFDRHMIRKFGMDLDQIAKAMQSLYDDKGLITYPRVDIKHLDVNMHSEMPEHIAAMAHNLSNAPQLSDKEKALYQKAFKILDPSKKSSIWKKGVDEGESHHAIIPTSSKVALDGLNKTEFLVYKELADRLIIQFLPDYEYSSTKITTKVGRLLCKTSGNTPLRKGWKGLSQNMEEESDSDDETGDLPILSIGDKVAVSDSETRESVTKEPKPYTVDELLGDLENPKKFVGNKSLLKHIKKLQIGTDGTRQDHVKSLVPKGFANLQSRKGSKKIKELVPTKKLIELIRVAPDYFKYPETSAYWEDAFNKIQAKEMSLEEFLAKQSKLIHRFFDDLKAGKFRLKEPIINDYKNCPDDNCKGFLFFRELKKKNFNLWSCSGCNSAYFDNEGEVGKKMGTGGKPGGGGQKKDVDWVPPEGTPKQACPECSGGKVYYKKIPGKSWALWECLSCKAAFFDNNGKPGNKKGKPKRKD